MGKLTRMKRSVPTNRDRAKERPPLPGPLLLRRRGRCALQRSSSAMRELLRRNLSRCAAICLAVYASFSLAAADFQPETLPLGAAAPDFKLPGVDGRDYSLADFAQAKILVVLFTCNHCPTAQYYEPRVKQLASDYKDKGVALVA